MSARTVAIFLVGTMSFVMLPVAPVIAAENPPLIAACGGLDITLVIDSSDSVTDGERGTVNELGRMKAAFNGVIDAMLPGTASTIAVIDFDQGVRVTQHTRDASIAVSAVAVASRGGGTDWASALEAARSLADPRADRQNVIIFASDGNPNHLGTPSIATTTAAALSPAVAIADDLKARGVRIVAIGIGNEAGQDALDIANLIAISGPRVNTGDATSDVITSGFAELATDLAGLAIHLCGSPSGGGGNGPIVGSLPSGGGSVSNEPIATATAAPASVLPGIPDTGAPLYPGVPNTGGGGRYMWPLLISSAALLLTVSLLTRVLMNRKNG